MVKVKEKSELVTVAAGDNLKKLGAKNFVRPAKHSALLPYFDELEEEADKNFHNIINGMVAAFLTENAIEASDYSDQFARHLRLFGLRMSKSKFLDLVLFFYEVLIKKDQNRSLMKTACTGFGKMMQFIKPGSFGWRDLTLDWKPIYELFLRALNKKIKPDISSNLQSVILAFSVFYHPEEHSKIWETLLQETTIGSNYFMDQFMSTCKLFLTVAGMTEEDVKNHVSWIQYIWDLYLNADMNTSWTSVCMELISEICYYHPGAINLSSHYDILFTKMIRSFELTVRGGKVAVGDGQETYSNSNLAVISVYTIGGPHSSLSHFQRLMQYILVNVHPLNAGDHTEQISGFLKDFIDHLQMRLEDERLKFKKRRCSSKYYLTDKDIDGVTESMTDLAIMLMFSISQDDYKLIHGLTTINREYVAPKLLEHLYSSLTAVSEPHRLTVIIEAISVVIFEIIRPADSEYRASRDITFDSTWLKSLEDERKNWPTYQIGTDIPEIKTHRFTTLRAHAFYIMEVFVNHINVSDMQRTSYIFKTLISLFSSFPLMDFSSAIEFHGKEMSEDDKIVCLLSKRIPHLIEFIFDKFLDIITCLSVVIPKTSGGEPAASLSNESQKQIGEDEVILKSGIAQLVKIMFENVNDTTRKRLLKRLFSYLTTSQFTNNVASETLSSLVSSAIWVNQDAFRDYVEFLSIKLKSLITDDIRKTRNPPSSVLFYVDLTRPLFTTTHQLILENETVLIEIIDLLLQCESTIIHKSGTFGVSSIIPILLTLDTETTELVENQMFKKPLKEWNPITYWARCYELKDTIIKWYIPAKPEIECAQRIANRFLFPYISDLTKKEYNRETLRRILNHVMEVLLEIDVFDHPFSIQNISDIYTPFCLPIPSSSLGKSCVLEFQLIGPNGENAREMILTMIEKVSNQTVDPASLISLSSIAFQCLGKRKNGRYEAEIESLLTDMSGVLIDSTYGKAKKASQKTMAQLAFIKHVQSLVYHTREIRHPNNFDQRILNCLFGIALNDYKKVRTVAVAYLKDNKNQLSRFRHIFIPKVMKVLIEEQKNMDRLSGAINLILELGWLKDANSQIRIVVWDAVLRLKVFDDMKICVLFEEICQSIYSINTVVRQRPGSRDTHEERNKALTEISKRLVVIDDFWKPFLTYESLKKQTDVWFDRKESRHQHRGNLVEMLFKNHIGNKNLHHTRENLAKTMVFHAQKEICDDRTIALLLSQLNDEQYQCRKEAREWLAHWLYENKPKTVRVDIKPPARVDHGISLESGIREDNLWLVYDSENLPNTESKWDDMIFIDSEKGSCRWPEKINVVRKRNEGVPLLLKRMTYSDRLIIDYFSQPDFVSSVLNSRIIEKEDHVLPNTQFYKMIKYVIRNYPDEKKPLELFKNTLKNLLKSKKREEQLLAAEIFLGIVYGLKHRSFEEIDKFWKEITVCLDSFFNKMVLDAEDSWSMALSDVLCGDPRRNWWLLESLISSAKKSTGLTEMQQSFRLSPLIFKRWRHGEIMKRVTEIAWSKLQTAVTDSLRLTVASVFCASAQIYEKNSTATVINVPQRFLTDSLDTTIQKIIEKIPCLKLYEDSESARNCLSDSSVLSPRSNAKRSRRRSIREDLRDRTSLIYFRTLLETIMQYYDVSMKSWSHSLVQILPKLMEYANEDDYDVSEETYRNVDISQNSAFIIHNYMSASWLRSEFVDIIVNSWFKTYISHSESSRVRLAVIKFVQASVYSNMYPMCVKSRRDKVENLLFKAVFDKDISVRKEGAKCLLLFVHCEYIHIPDEKVDEFAIILHSKTSSEAHSHGAALALGALTLAYPFSLPSKIVKPLRILSSTISKRAIVQQTMTETVREFRRQHRDDWIKTKEILGESLVYDIENATAPAYYA